MNKRESRLLTLFIVVGGGVIFSQFIYPSVIQPVVDYSGKNESASKELFQIEEKHGAKEDQLRSRYEEYVSRIGGYTVDDAGFPNSPIWDDLHKRLSLLINQKELIKSNTNVKEPTTDRKTKIETLAISFSAKGSFDRCVGLLESFYKEFPDVARIDHIKITPTDPQGRATHNQCSLSGEIEALILPREDDFEDLEPKGEADAPVRLAKSNYSRLASREPFKLFVPHTPKPEPVQVAQTDRPKPTPRPTPEPLGPPEDPNRWDKVVRMVMSYGGKDMQIRELLIENMDTEETEYVAVGEDLDGGEVVFVHPLGAVVHKENDDEDFGFYVYPLGESLGDSLAYDDAAEWPEIRAAFGAEQASAHSEPQDEEIQPEQLPQPNAEPAVPTLPAEKLDEYLPDDFFGPPYPRATADASRRDEGLEPAVPGPRADDDLNASSPRGRRPRVVSKEQVEPEPVDEDSVNPVESATSSGLNEETK